MHTILAIDPGTHTGVCIGQPGCKPVLWTEKFRHNELDDHDDIAGRAIKWIERTLTGDGCPTIVAIEAPVPPMSAWGATNFQTTRITLGMRFAFGGVARSRGMGVFEAPINGWRKYALGVGKLKGVEAKKQMVQLVKRLGWGDVNHNAAEACGIWLWACAQLAPAQTQRHEPLFAVLR